VTDYLQANCICCGTITDVVDGSKDPALCVECSDNGGAKAARTMKAYGIPSEQIQASMGISRVTLWRWLHRR
jgi:hypothetical protein